MCTGTAAALWRAGWPLCISCTVHTVLERGGRVSETPAPVGGSAIFRALWGGSPGGVPNQSRSWHGRAQHSVNLVSVFMEQRSVDPTGAGACLPRTGSPLRAVVSKPRTWAERVKAQDRTRCAPWPLQPPRPNTHAHAPLCTKPPSSCDPLLLKSLCARERRCCFPVLSQRCPSAARPPTPTSDQRSVPGVKAL